MLTQVIIKIEHIKYIRVNSNPVVADRESKAVIFIIEEAVR